MSSEVAAAVIAGGVSVVVSGITAYGHNRHGLPLIRGSARGSRGILLAWE